MPTNIVLATSNPGKLREFQELLHDFPADFIGLSEAAELAGLDHALPDVEETGSSFEENARIKARAYAQALRLPVLADDSGLVIDALNGEPGVFSARYVDGTDADRVAAVIKKMAGEKNRAAQFVCSLVYVDPVKAEERVFFGTVEGRIAEKSLGSRGFGYDAIFFPEQENKTFGQMSSQEKARYSHRARAVSQFIHAFLTKSREA